MPRVIFSIGFIIFLSTSLHAAGPKWGNWKVTVKQYVDGLSVDRGEISYEQCLTEPNPVPTYHLTSGQCDVLHTELKRRSLTWEVSCFTQHGSVLNKGKIKFGVTRFRGKSQSELGEVVGKQTSIRYSLMGNYTGPCKE